jgi:uncharacterized protein (TIGR03067 family)
MRRAFVLLVVAGCASVAGAGAESEVKRLQGAWKPVRLERAGETVADGALPGARFVVDGSTLRFRVGDHTLLDVRFSVSPTRTPAHIDLTSVAGPTRGQTLRGIYRLEGGQLTLCWPLGEDRQRPTRFDTKGDRDWVVLTLVRE